MASLLARDPEAYNTLTTANEAVVEANNDEKRVMRRIEDLEAKMTSVSAEEEEEIAAQLVELTNEAETLRKKVVDAEIMQAEAGTGIVRVSKGKDAAEIIDRTSQVTPSLAESNVDWKVANFSDGDMRAVIGQLKATRFHAQQLESQLIRERNDHKEEIQEVMNLAEQGQEELELRLQKTLQERSTVSYGGVTGNQQAGGPMSQFSMLQRNAAMATGGEANLLGVTSFNPAPPPQMGSRLSHGSGL